MTGRLPSAPGADPGGPDMAGIVDQVLDLLGGRSDRSRRLFGGVIAGAVIGAAVAGFVLHQRPGRDRRRRP